MILLDTNIVSELMDPNFDPIVEEWLNKQRFSTLFISSITSAEIEYGITLLPSSHRKRTLRMRADKIFYEYADQFLVFGGNAAQEYGRLRADRKKVGRPIDIADAQIAAIAVAHDLTLATRNIKDFTDIPRLQLINPWDA